jgi:uncharacterized protein
MADSGIYLRRRVIKAVLGCCAALAAGAAWAAPIVQDGPVKVVYQVSDGVDQAAQALRNVRNHLEADPTAKIVVVSLAGGVDFMLDGARDKNGNLFDANVQELVKMGVEFRVCKTTLKRRNIDPRRVIEEGSLVPSGVAEIARLQAKEGFAYLKP